MASASEHSAPVPAAPQEPTSCSEQGPAPPGPQQCREAQPSPQGATETYRHGCDLGPRETMIPGMWGWSMALSSPVLGSLHPGIHLSWGPSLKPELGARSYWQGPDLKPHEQVLRPPLLPSSVHGDPPTKFPAGKEPCRATFYDMEPALSQGGSCHFQGASASETKIERNGASINRADGGT